MLFDNNKKKRKSSESTFRAFRRGVVFVQSHKEAGVDGKSKRPPKGSPKVAKIEKN